MTEPRTHLRPLFLQPLVLLTWAVTIAWAGVISELSTGAYSGSITGWLLAQLLLTLHIHLTPQSFEIIHFLIRKLAHITEYAILGLLLYHSFESRHLQSWKLRSAFIAVVVAGLFSLTDEYHQSFVPGRSASLADCGIDTAGSFLGLVLLYAARRLQARSRMIHLAYSAGQEMKNGAEGDDVSLRL